MKNLDVTVTEETASCGGVVYWTLSGPVDLPTLREAWCAEGLDENLLPAAPTVDRALRTALDRLRDRRHILRPLPDRSGWAVVAEHEVDPKASEYKTSLRAYIERASDGTESVMVDPSSHPDAERLYDAFDAASTAYTPNDISSLLIKMVVRAHAVSLRTMGGLYFVPAAGLVDLMKATAAIEKCSQHRVWRLPAMRSEEAARAVFASLTDEMEAHANELEKDLEDATERKINTRQDKLVAMRAKVEEYEQMMGGSLESLRERLERVQAGLAAAMLASQDAEQVA